MLSGQREWQRVRVGAFVCVGACVRVLARVRVYVVVCVTHV